MSATHCPGCGRAIPVADHEIGSLVITCAGCDTRFVPRAPSFAPAAREPRAGVADVMRASLWFLCVCWTGLVALVELAGAENDVSAVQQAARAAHSCLWVLAGYVCCRAVDAALRALAGTRGR